MNRGPVQRIPGFHDATGAEAETKAAVEAALFDYIGLAGYARIETPVVEEAELFLRMSGGELASRMYSFTDPGGHRVALRPEFTASVIRAHIDAKTPTAAPVRLRYSGPVFRYSSADDGTLRQRTQIGGELIGVADGVGDAEMLAIACGGLRVLGIKGATLTLGHMGVIRDLLDEFGLSDRAELFLLRHLQNLRNPDRGVDFVRRQAAETGIAREGAGSSTVAAMDATEAQAVLSEMLGGLGESTGGGRDMAKIEQRFLSKLRSSDHPEKLDRAITFLAELCSQEGTPHEVMAHAKKTIDGYRLNKSPLDSVSRLVKILDERILGDTKVVLDFGFARGIAYYTGMVFEIGHENASSPLCGGGRYDGLVRALGGRDEAALGFAYSVEEILPATPGIVASATHSVSEAVSQPANLFAAVGQWDAGEFATVSADNDGKE